MSDDTVVFDKEKFRELKAELRRVHCRSEHIKAELEAVGRKVSGLMAKLEAAQEAQQARRDLLCPELADLEKRAEAINKEIKDLES